MKDRFKGDYIKIIKKLVDTSKFPAIFCSVSSNTNNLSHFPKIVHCNTLFEDTFDKKCINIKDKDFDSIINFNFPENEYIKFIKKVKNFEKATAKAKININQENRCFAISFHPLVFMSTYDKKYCLIDYIPINDIRDNPEDIYDILESVKGNINNPITLEETSKNVNRILNNENFLKKVYKEIEKGVSLKRTLNKITKLLAEYLKANRIIIHVYNTENTIRYFTEYVDEGILKLLDENNKVDKSKYINHINKLIETNTKQDNKLNVIFIREKDNNSKIEIIKDIIKKYRIKSQMIIEDEVQNNIFVRVYVHQCYGDKEWQNYEIELTNRIIERLSLIIEKNINVYKLKSANKKLTQQAKELRESLLKEQEIRKIQTEFIAMVSHQFRTPLQIIESTRGVLKRRLNTFEELNDEQRVITDQLVAKIKNAVFRMNTLINKTLDLSNIETTGDINYYPSYINLKQVLEECINRLIQNNNNVIIKKSLNNLPTIFYGDEKLLEHAFGNIIENAIKYSKKGGVVEVYSKLKNDDFVISIKDYGVGIPKDDMGKIFNKFARAKNVKTMNGTGIGLFLVKKFIKKHKGEIKVKSEENKGTTFHLIFPINNKSQD